MILMNKYKDMKEQHDSVRNAVGWYDFTHHLVEVTGADASAFLDNIYTNSIGKAKVGRAKYTTMLDEDGIIIDDVIVFHIAEEKFWISTLYIRDLLLWFDAHKQNMDVNYEKITEEWMMYSVQEPKAKELVNAVLLDNIDELKFFSIADNKMNGIPVKIARGGYTGEKWGYEIYFAPDQEAIIDSKLSEKGLALGGMKVTETDIKALTLPGEKGFILMLDVAHTNPFEVGLEGFIEWEKDFIGKKALERIKIEGPKQQLVGFRVKEENPLIYGGPHGNPVIKDGEVVGKVTKFIYGFTVEEWIGYAVIDRSKAVIGDAVTINGYETVLKER